MKTRRTTWNSTSPASSTHPHLLSHFAECIHRELLVVFNAVKLINSLKENEIYFLYIFLHCNRLVQAKRLTDSELKPIGVKITIVKFLQLFGGKQKLYKMSYLMPKRVTELENIDSDIETPEKATNTGKSRRWITQNKSKFIWISKNKYFPLFILSTVHLFFQNESQIWSCRIRKTTRTTGECIIPSVIQFIHDLPPHLDSIVPYSTIRSYWVPRKKLPE